MPNDSTPAHPPLKQVLAVVAGNGLEYYDFVTYAFFASQIGRAFFPSDTPGTSLLASLATLQLILDDELTRLLVRPDLRPSASRGGSHPRGARSSTRCERRPRT